MPDPTVFVVDDDEAVRNSLQWLIQSVSINVQTFADAREFLERYNRDDPGCLVLDVRMPGMSGLELQEVLEQRGIHLPVIIITGHANVPMAVRAMKAGAAEFIEKPFRDQELLDQIQLAIERDSKNRARREAVRHIHNRLARLTPRENEVMELVVAGHSSKQIAALLEINQKTIEAHRAHVMKKMGAASVADLVREVLSARAVEESQPTVGN